jgi:hypothetical protein
MIRCAALPSPQSGSVRRNWSFLQCRPRRLNYAHRVSLDHSTALDDLLGIEEGKINNTRLYRCLDRILPHKTKLEQHLK